MVLEEYMNTSQKMIKGVLYIISCGCSSASLTQNVVMQAQSARWDVCVITTPNGKKFLNMPLLAQLTGHPVRSEYKQPDEPDVLPRADAIVVFPASFNTINKWALGISDTLAVGLLSEYTGLDMPIIAVPCFKTGGGLNTNPAFKRSVRMLRRYGVCVIYEPEKYPPKNQVPADVILETLEDVIRQKREKRT
jgi:phosphopantothenoylcysteine synthetase/decarboxylase